MRRYVDPRFKAQLQTFTKQGAEVDRQKRTRLQAHIVREAYDTQIADTQSGVRRQEALMDQIEEIAQWNVSDDTRRQAEYLQSQQNLNAFLQQYQQPESRNICAELQGTLSLFRPDPTNHPILLEDSRRPPASPKPQPAQEQLRISTIMADVPPRGAPEVSFQQNDKFIQQTLVLASYLDIKNGTLLGRNSVECCRITRASNAFLQSQTFADFLCLHVGNCTPETIVQTVAKSSPSAGTDRLLAKLFAEGYFQYASGKTVVRRPGTYLQTIAQSQDAFQQLFVTACFWRLGGGKIEEREIDGCCVPVFV